MTKGRRRQPAKGPVVAGRGAPRSAATVRWPLWLGAVLALTFVAFLPSLDNDFVGWDDELYVTQNALLADPGVRAVLTTPVAGNYHPLTIWSLALNFRFSGLNPASYHWLSLLLHLANTALVFLFIRQLSKGRLWTTVGTSLLFGIHPMHVESVAWISARKDVLYAFFYLIGLIAYLRYVDGRKRVWLLAALAAFVLSAASKPAAIVFPLALLAIDYFRRRPFTMSLVLEKAPFFAVALADTVLTLIAQKGSGAISHAWDPFEKLQFAAYGTVIYLAKFFVPAHLSAIYPYPSPSTGPGPEFLVVFVIAVVLWPATAYLCRRSRPIQFGLAFYFIGLILVLQIFTLGGAVMADRYTYLPYVGLAFAFLWWLDERPGPGRAGLPVRPIVAAVFALLVPACVLLTWQRCEVWRNPLTLWNDAIQKYPGQIADAHVNRAMYYYRQGKRLDLALADFNRALSISSRTPLIWSGKGNVLAAVGEYDSALVCYDRAIELDPKWADAWNNRGAAKLRKGDAAAAILDLSRAVAMNPTYRQAYLNRAIAYVDLRQYENAIGDCRRVIELEPRSPDVYIQLGTIGLAQLELKRYREAIAAFDEAIRQAPPGEPRLGVYYLYRSSSWRALDDRARALADAREALRLGADVSPEYLRELEAPGARPAPRRAGSP